MQRAADITFYEELGVPKTATPAEIRDAFRALVRLLHPDQQTDEQLKLIAEAQMRKLNRIYSVLSDTDRRRHYDQSMEAPAPSPAIVFTPASQSHWHPQRLLARFAWIGAALVTVAVLFWLASEAPSSVPLQVLDRATPQKAPSVAPTNVSGEVDQLRADLKAARSERDAAIQQLARLRGLPAPRKADPEAIPPPQRPAPPTPVTAATTELPTNSMPVPPPAYSPPSKTAAAPVRTLAGFWFYIPPPSGQHNKNASLYPPEFIEATLTEQNGTVRGRYRSRYQIVDRAISPDVNFEFSGSPRDGLLNGSWSGMGGARGELKLKLTGENSLEIQWTASELGSVQGLVSGTAKLTRRLE